MPTVLAKLTRPRLYQAVARERLFRILDVKREHPVVWVAGPPGSGKTTLVASYLDASRSPAIWYQLDRGDSDPATFFYYLVQAVGAASRSRGRSLPLLTPEYLSDLDGFSRRFFRNAFARLPEGSLLILDNYQEIASDSALHQAVNAAIAEVPNSGNLLVISRMSPPGLFVRAQVAGSLDVLGWEDLRLAPDETAAIVARRKVLDPQLVATLHERSGGWVAGVRLLLQGESTETTMNPTRQDNLESTFDYFAAEFFDTAPEPLRLVLLRTAFFPRFTVGMAATISGNPDAGELLDLLYKRRLFIDRRPGTIVTYQYHDLFRVFLRHRANQIWSPNEIATITAESAALLLEENLPDEAFRLFVQARDWTRAEEIFLKQAPKLLSSGRWLTLADWANALPKAKITANPWLLYWLGCSKALTDAAAAYPILEAAYDSFVKNRDSYGQLLCAAAAIETLHFLVEQWNTMGLWLNRLKESLGQKCGNLPPDDELRVHAALIWAADNSEPGSGISTLSVERSLQLLPLCGDVNLRVSVANMLHYHAGRTLDSRTTQVAAREAHPALDSPNLSADRSALYYLAEGFAHMDFARYREAFDCYDRADTIIANSGLAGRAHIAGVWRAYSQCAMGDWQAARSTLVSVEAPKSVNLHVITMLLENTRAWVAFGDGNVACALEHNLAAAKIAGTMGPHPILAWILANRAYLLIVAGQLELAGIPIEQLEEQTCLVAYQRFGGATALLDAWRAHRLRAEARCREALRRCLSMAEDERDRLRMRWYPKALEVLLPIAMDQGIEIDTARKLIRECRIDPPLHASDNWPWPLKVYTLGRFEIFVDEKPLEFGRKVPKRTLALLKAVIALGGSEVAEQKLIDCLWPEQDGDAAVESLAAALHRLRRLLGGNDLIRQIGGTLSLNEERVFVDARAFEAEADDPVRRGVALKRYRGGFLEGDNETWATSPRERLRGKFVRAIENEGADLELSKLWPEAIELYLRGIETDDLIEPFYRGLMRCYQKLGRDAEAASAFRRLRQILSVTLGTKPAVESQRLFDMLRLQ
jgi:LuxR family transcriptional regulator, maltose regulon positive regulatory protein